MHNKDLRKSGYDEKIKENYEFHEDAQGLRLNCLKNCHGVGDF